MARYPLDSLFPEDEDPAFIPSTQKRMPRQVDPALPGIMSEEAMGTYGQELPSRPDLAFQPKFDERVPEGTSDIVTGQVAPKRPWEMTPRELGLTDDGTPIAEAKRPWQMSEEELGLGVPAEGAEGKGRRVPGARGQKPLYRLSDKSSVYGRAQRADVGIEGVSAAARFNAASAWGALQDPAMELEIARKAISRDLGVDYPIENLRVGPGTKMLEWVNPKTGKWDLFAGAGSQSFFKDIAAAAPELREAGLEGLGGVAGGTAVGLPASLLGPIGTGVGVTTGNAIGTFAAAYYARLKRLEYSKQVLGLDISDEDMNANAMSHALLAGGSAVGSAVALGIAKKIWQSFKGSPIDLLETYKKSERLAEGKPLADSLEARVKAGLGDEASYPMSAGQQSALPEMFEQPTPGMGMVPRAAVLPRDRATDEVLKAQEAAVRLRLPGDKGLGDIYATQQQTNDAMAFAVFGHKSPVAEREAGAIVRRAVQDLKFGKRTRAARDTRLLEEGKEIAGGMLEAAGARSTQASLGSLRTKINDAKEQLFRGFKDAYDALESNSVDMIELGPLREAAKAIEKKYGQKIIQSLDAADIPEVREAKNAGIVNAMWRNIQLRISQPKSIGELERLRKDLTEAIMQLKSSPSYAGPKPGKPRAQAVLHELRDGIDAAMEKGLTPEAWAHVKAIRDGYAEASEKFNKGIVGEIMETNGPGMYKMTGNDAAEYLMADPENARAFINAAWGSSFLVPGKGLVFQRQKDMTDAVMYAQEGVTSWLAKKFKNAETGKWDTKGLQAWFHEHDEAARELFGWTRGIDDGLVPSGRVPPGKNITEFQRRADALQERLVQQAKKFDERFGVFTGNPAQLARSLLDDSRFDDLKVAWNLVNKRSTRAEAQKFKDGLTSVARREVSNEDGTLNITKLSNFADSEQAQKMTEILGKQWIDNVRTLRDMMKVHELRASGAAPRDLANAFTLGVPGLRGLSRLVTVALPPMTARGRGLTGLVGITNEKTQKKLGELMAQPDKLQELLGKKYTLTKALLTPTSKAGQQVLARFGLEHLTDFWRVMDRAYGITVDSILEDDERRWAANEAWEDTRAQEAEYQRMGQETPGIRPKGGETPGYGQMPEGMKAGLSDVPGLAPDEMGSDIPGQYPGYSISNEPLTNEEEAEAAFDEMEGAGGKEQDAAERFYYNQELKRAPQPKPALRGSRMNMGGPSVKVGRAANDNRGTATEDMLRKQLEQAIRAGNTADALRMLEGLKRLQGR